jgi:osmotically-inducible protein OsmY
MGKNTDIREAAEAELGEDPLVDATDITVKNTNGDVALDGTLRTTRRTQRRPRRPGASRGSPICTTT